MITAVTALGFVTDRVLRPTNVNMVYLFGVLVMALRWGRRPAAFTAVISAIVFDFCFVPPYLSFAITDLAYLTTLVGFLAVALATSELGSRSRQLAVEHAERLRAEARSEAMDEVLNKISHELRSPLSALLGWTQMMTRADIDDSRKAKALASIDRSGRLLGRLIDDLLTVARVNSGKLVVNCRPTALDPIIANSIAAMTATAQQKGVQVETVLEAVGPVLADEQRIEQITTNLLSNAIKFTPSGGCVSVQLHRTGTNAELVVSDTGVGIPAGFLPHVFEPFSQADLENAKQGLGLGMSIVNHLVKAHGGSIVVASKGQGQGTTFTVRLPTIATEHRSPSA